MAAESDTGGAANGAEAVRLADTAVPDVILMDLRMPGTDGTTATEQIMRARPATRVVILTTFDDDEDLYPALAAGACGYLAKDATPTELVDAIRQAAAGGSPFSNEVLRRLVEQATKAHIAERRPQRAVSLTPREREVLGHVAMGLSNADIANRMHAGVTTVKTHVVSRLRPSASYERSTDKHFSTGRKIAASTGGGKDSVVARRRHPGAQDSRVLL